MKLLMIPPLLLLLSSCGYSPEPKVAVQTNYVERSIPLQSAPDPVYMPEVEWYVVNEDNLDEFLGRVNDDVGDVVFISITPNGYENLALGIAELRRYIQQQKEIIAYYEEAVAPVSDKVTQ